MKGVNTISKSVNGLTVKQNMFVSEYMVSFNASDAARKAGYSVKGCRTAGCTLLTNPNVKAAIALRMKDLENKKIASADEVLQYLTSIVRGDEVEEVVLVVGTGNGVSETARVNKKISAKDKLAAAHLLGKRYTLFTDKVELNGEVVVFKGADLLED